MASFIITVLFNSVLLAAIQGYIFSGVLNDANKQDKFMKTNQFLLNNGSTDGLECYFHLASIASDVFIVQNDLKPCLYSDYMKNSSVVILLYHNPTFKLALRFEEIIFNLHPRTEFLYYDLETEEKLNNSIFFRTFSTRSNINSVVVFADNDTVIIEFIEFMCSDLAFRWTSFLHLTEWIIVTTSSATLKKLQAKTLITDFLTLIFSPDCDNIFIAQKSRTAKLQVVLELLNKNKTDKVIPACKQRLINLDTGHSGCQGSQFLNETAKLRAHPVRYLAKKKSILAGFHLSAAILPVDDVRALFRYTHKNVTLHDGFSIALINVLQTALGFTYELTYADDGGYYGAVNDDGTVNGITGQLARREAALTTMPMSWIENRQQAIDFVPVPTIVENVFNIIYRLPKDGEHLDTTYIDIVETELLLYTLGPLLFMGFVAGLTHVATKSCEVAEPQKYSDWELRKVYSCPEHMCFQSRKVYESHTGRVLKASWGLFCLILGGAYSAHLVTTFTVEPKELSIQTFEELLNHKEFKFGVQRSQTALITTFKTAKDATLQEVWQKLVQFNQTDPSIFTANVGGQIKKVLAGRYALIHPINIDRMSDFVEADYSDVRIYNQETLDRISYSYVAVPKCTFFQEELYLLLLNLEETGILLKLKSAYNLTSSLPGDSSSATGKLRSSHQTVTFYRIQLLVYVAAAGIGLSFVILCVECLSQLFYRFLQDTE